MRSNQSSLDVRVGHCHLWIRYCYPKGTTTELPVNFLIFYGTKALANNKISVARNSKAKSKSFRKKVERLGIILLESLFYTLAAYFCTKGFNTCTKGEMKIMFFSLESESESLGLDERIAFVSGFCHVGLLVLFSLRQM